MQHSKHPPLRFYFLNYDSKVIRQPKKMIPAKLSGSHLSPDTLRATFSICLLWTYHSINPENSSKYCISSCYFTMTWCNIFLTFHFYKIKYYARLSLSVITKSYTKLFLLNNICHGQTKNQLVLIQKFNSSQDDDIQST